MNKNYLLIGAAVLMAVIFAIAAYLYNSQQAQTQIQAASQNSETLTRSYSPRIGNPDAKVTIVEFMDPACETCRQFHPFVKQLMDKHDGKINLVIRYAPFHPGSDLMVKILEGARKQDKFWEVLDLMFDTQPQWASHHNPQPQVFWSHLEQTGFDMARLEQDMLDPAILKIIEQDLADGKLLGANKTPTFFVNGKPLPSFGFQQLEGLVNTEILANY